VVRKKDGRLELAELAAPPPGAPREEPAPAAESPAPPLHTEVGEVSLSRFAVDVLDQEPETPGKLRLSAIDLRVGQFAHPSDAPIDLGLQLALNESGSLSVKGQVRPSGAADLQVAIDRLALPWLQPWVAEQARVQLAKGVLQLAGRARYAPRDKGGPEIAFDGALSLDQLSVAAPATGKELVGWDGLSLTGIAYRSPPQTLQIGAIALRAPRGHAVKGADGKLDLSGLAKESRAPAEAQAPPAKASAPIKVAIGSFTVDRGAFDYTDRTLQPAFAVRLSQLKGRVQPIAWPDPARTKLELAGRLDAAPFQVRGDVTPRGGKQMDLVSAISLKGWDLPPTSSYSIKYTGYPVTKGKLSLDLKYTIEKRKLQGANGVLVDQPTLGEHQDVEGATRLPVKLALAILTDRHGQLKVDLPVSGDLDDPKFGFGGVILGALLNLLEKVATSPFALLGGLFGGDEDPGSVDFAAGSSDLAEKEKGKLAKLGQALVDRPGLRLEIAGSVQTDADRAALALAAVRERLHRAAPGAARAGDDPVEYQRRIRVAWRELKRATQDKEPAVEEMEKELVAAEAVPERALSDLAEERAREVQEALLEIEGIEAERVFMVSDKREAAGKAQAVLKLQ
jgi:hypothetical protein